MINRNNEWRISMRNLMRSNIYDVEETIVIVGSCLKSMQSQGYEKIKKLSENIYELCLEETHINMAITKIGGMLRTGKIKIKKSGIYSCIGYYDYTSSIRYLFKEK